MSRITAALAALGLAALAASSASQAAVVAVGASNTHRCMRLAFAGASDRRAIDACNAALAEEVLTGPDRAGALVNRGVIHFRRGATGLARADFEQALRVNPRSGDAFLNRGVLRIAEGRYAEGAVDIDTGLRLGLRQPEKAYYNRAIAREALSDTRGAYLDYRRAARLRPDWEAPRAELARFTVTQP